MKKISILSCIFMCLTLLVACNGNKTKKTDEGFKFDDAIKKSDVEVTKSFIYLFPSPGDILDRFNEAEITYLSDIVHDPAKSDQYLSSRDKGLNLGIYITDMAYAAMFSRSAESAEYMDVIKGLSSELHVSTSTFENLIERAQNNVNNSDSLLAISNEVFYNMVEFLEYSGKESTIAVISCGSYIESMYIAMNSIDEFDENNPLVKQITELKFPMENLMGHAESVSDDPNVQSIINYIRELTSLFNELDEESSKVTKSEPGVISFSSGSAPELTAGNFNAMKVKVDEIRNHITSNQKN